MFDNFNSYINTVLIASIVLLSVNLYLSIVSRRRKLANKELMLKKKRLAIIIIANIAILTVLAIIIALGYTSLQPKISLTTPKTEAVWEAYSKPVEVFFNTPVDKSRLNMNMNPQIKGEWVFNSYLGISRLTDYAYFLPEETLFPKQRVVVYITGIGRIGMRSESHEYGFVFDSVKPLEIESTLPANESLGIELDAILQVNLEKTLNKSNEISFSFIPVIEFDLQNLSEKQITIVPKNKLEFGTKYVLQAFRRSQRVDLKTDEILESENPVLIFESSFTTKTEPLIDNYLPRGTNVRLDSKIRIRFVNLMNQESVEKNFSTIPQTEGKLLWDGKMFEFEPLQPLIKDTKYTIVLKQGSSDLEGLIIDKDFAFEFTTIGFVEILKFSPANAEVQVATNLNTIKVDFNQEIDNQSAQERFLINPNLTGSITWEGNSLIFKPSTELIANTNYTLSFAPGIKSIYGFDSIEELRSSFKTKNNQVIIELPLYYQPQYPVSFSCNIYAAKMALAWKGYSTDITQLISEIGNDASQDQNGRWTGNPNSTYVGNADGTWGYGVHWIPIQKMFTNRGIKTDLYTGWNVSELAKSIEQGKPVVIWRYNGTSADRNLEWGTNDIYAINGQHGGVVSGFRGTVNNPTSFYINDPWFGLIWMDVNTFDYYWSRLERVGLVIN